MHSKWRDFAPMRELRSFTEIEQWVADNYLLLYPYDYVQQCIKKGNAPPKVTVQIRDMEHHECVSNGHHAPAGGTTNWGGYESGPIGYPGWLGYMHSHMEDSSRGIYPRFDHTGICTGAGGANHGWDVIFFDSDFSGLEYLHNLCELGLDPFPVRKLRTDVRS